MLQALKIHQKKQKELETRASKPLSAEEEIFTVSKDLEEREEIDEEDDHV